MGLRALIGIVRRLGGRRVGGSPKLTKSLELIEEFVHDVETPVGDEEECLACCGGIFVRGFLEDEVEELAVGVPSFDAVRDFGALNRLEMAKGEFIVECKEEGVAVAF